MKSLNPFQAKIKQAVLLALAPLAMLLSSCANEPQITACSTLPVAYLAHLDKTAFRGETYGDVTQYAVILKRERDICLNRVDKIREWQVENAQH